MRELRAENMMRWWWLSWLKKRRLANDEFILVNLLVYPPLDGYCKDSPVLYVAHGKP